MTPTATTQEALRMGMYDEMLRDQENTIIVLCKHLRRCLTLLEAYADMDEEEKFLADTLKKRGLESEDLKNE